MPQRLIDLDTIGEPEHGPDRAAIVSVMCNARAAGLRTATIRPISTFASSPTFLPHLRHYCVLVLFVVTSFNTMTRQDRRWNESAMRNSVAAADMRKSSSMTAAPIPTPWTEEHRREVVDEHMLLMMS
jgi:hypothetical protein